MTPHGQFTLDSIARATPVAFDRGLLAFARKNGYAAVMPA